jgi:hypothetical protein
MYHDLFDRLALNEGEAFSSAVSMDSNNAAVLSYVVVRLTGDDVTFTLQESSDLENWRDRTGTGASSVAVAPCYTLADTASGIAAQFLRVHVQLAPDALAVISAGINIASL